MNKFYKITSQNELDTIQNELIEKGYKSPNGELLTMDDFKKAYPKNKIYLINAFYNTINKKYEYIGGTKQIYERNYGKKIKFEN